MLGAGPKDDIIVSVSANKGANESPAVRHLYLHGGVQPLLQLHASWCAPSLRLLVRGCISWPVTSISEVHQVITEVAPGLHGGQWGLIRTR